MVQATTTIQLACAENAILTVSLEVARVSEVISGMIDDGGDINEAIPVPKVKKHVLEKVMVFCEHQI